MHGDAQVGVRLTATDMASGPLARVQKELRGFGPGGSIAAGAMGMLGKASRGVSGALGHFKGAIGGLLSGPLGLIGLGAGVLGVEKAFSSGIEKATEWGLSIEKLTGLTSNSAEQLSGLLAVTEKFGISNERIAQIVGFTEKTLGKLSAATVAVKDAQGKVIATQTKLQALGKLYGVTLTDTKGKALDFQSVLLNVADAYAKATTAAQKARAAALAASVFGRGYADLLPILKLGKQGILDAEEAAKELGLTLSTKNVADLAKYREAMREAGDAVSGLQLQFGLLVVPDLTTAFKGFVDFMRSHQKDIHQFFADGLRTAENIGGFIMGTLIPAIQSVASAAGKMWDSIPAPVRDLLVKTYVANRVIKFLFGVDVVKTVVGAIEGLVSGIATKAGGAAISHVLPQDVVVVAFSPLAQAQMAGGGALGGAESAAGGAASSAGGIAGKLGTILKFAGAIGLAAVAVELFTTKLQPLNEYIAKQTTDIGAAATGNLKTGSDQQLKDQLGGLVDGLNKLQETTGGLGPLQGVLYGSQIKMLQDQIKATQDELNRRGAAGFDTRSEAHGTAASAPNLTGGDTHGETRSIQIAGLAANAAATRANTEALKEAARKYEDIGGGKKGVAARSAAKFGGGGLGDAAVNATLQRDILRTSKSILKSHQTTEQKIADLKVLAKQGDTKTRATLSSDIKKLKMHVAVKTSTIVSVKDIITGTAAHDSATNIVTSSRSEGITM